MKLRGSEIVVKALEDEGVRFTFGIPGTHNIELYDALERSGQIEPILVTDEQSASFMADGVSRTSDTIGVVNVVPGAGVTHCLSGVGEAYMDNVPLLVLTCGIRNDTGKAYQLHDVDQLAILKPITKATFKPEDPRDIYSLVRHACHLARNGTPGPVAVEIPANYYLLTQEIEGFVFNEEEPVQKIDEGLVKQAAEIINQSKFPALYVGNGARNAVSSLIELAEAISAPVTTSIQGKGVFPEDHPLWLWNGFGPSAPDFVNKTMKECDCLIAIGCRFGEVATASYGFNPPENLIHVDINKEVFNKNYPAKLNLESDADEFVRAVLPHLKAHEKNSAMEREIHAGHRSVKDKWRENPSKNRVTPDAFFRTLQKHAGPDAIYSTDSGNGTFLGVEHLRLNRPGLFIGPIDYSCMGYSVPAAIGAKFANPRRDVIALAGDGALLMTGLELLTASNYKVAPLVCVLRDGELAQIAQFQRTTLNRDTCSILPPYSVKEFAKTTNCEFLNLETDGDLEIVLSSAFNKTRAGTTVVVNVAIDYSRKTYFTKGVVATNFWRLPWGERLRMLGRAVGRRLKPKST